MKVFYKRLIADYVSHRLLTCRKEKILTQKAMAELLLMDVRSYSDLELNKYCAGKVTFCLFLARFDVDLEQMKKDIRAILRLVLEDEETENGLSA